MSLDANNEGYRLLKPRPEERAGMERVEREGAEGVERDGVLLL